MAVANKPGGTSFNPLLIFGGVGLGKTHLAHAIGLRSKTNILKKQFYTFLPKFSQQYIDSVRKTTEMILFILSTNRCTNY
jgi:chromosomal replication initiator protein